VPLLHQRRLGRARLGAGLRQLCTPTSTREQVDARADSRAVTVARARHVRVRVRIEALRARERRTTRQVQVRQERADRAELTGFRRLHRTLRLNYLRAALNRTLHHFVET